MALNKCNVNQNTSESLALCTTPSTIFRKRAGTTDLGKVFEHLFILYLTLKLIENDRVEDFLISSNDDNYGAFDDAVLEVKYKRKNYYETYALQLKHKTSGTLKNQDLSQAKGDFSIRKYLEDYEKNLSKTEVKVILFTNLKFQKSKNQLKLNLKNEERECHIFKVKETTECGKFNELQMLRTHSEGKVYKVDSKETFFENFFLFTNQLNVEGLKTECLHLFTKIFCSQEDIFQKYLNFINNWSLKAGTKEKLNKSWIQKVLSTLVLTPFIRPLVFTSEASSEKAELFQKAVSEFQVTVLNENSYHKIKFVWKNATHNVDLEELNKINRKYQIMSDHIHEEQELVEKKESIEISKLLWLMGKCPLIVKKHESVTKAVELLKFNNFVILRSEKETDSLKCQIQNKSCFQHLSNLKNDKELYNDILHSFTFAIEGQTPALLKELVQTCKNVDYEITADNLLEMVEGNFQIGKTNEIFLPSYYVPRSISRIFIRSEYLKEFSENTLVVISCVTHLDSFKRSYKEHEIVILDEDIVQKSGEKKIIYVTENECSQEQLDRLCSKNPQKTNCHLMKYDCNLDCFEWIRSLNGVKDLQKFRLSKELAEFRRDKNNSIEESEFFADSSRNLINFVCENPGMGKTMFMKSLKKNSPSSVWAIFIMAGNHAQHFRKNEEADAEKFFNYIVKKSDNDIQTQSILQNFVSQNRIILVWDGLDEVTDETLKTIKSIIRDVSEKRIRQWITSRINLEEATEKEFDLFCRRIDQFNEEEQKTFIKNRLQCSDNELLNIFDKINSSIQHFPNNTILGIPLHIYILTELLIKDKEPILSLLDNKEQFSSISDMYGYLVDTIITKYYDEKMNYNSRIDCIHLEYYIKNKTNAINNYMKIAFLHYLKQNTKFLINIRASFEKSLNKTKCRNILKKIKKEKDPFGFIIKVTEDMSPQFLHNSFGEYFAALYLSKNIRQIKNIPHFKEYDKFDNIRFFVDSILSKNSKAHLAVLYRNCDLLDQYNEHDLERTDCRKRNSFILSCEWIKKCPVLKTERLSKDSFIIYDSEIVSKKNGTNKFLSYVRTWKICDIDLKKIILLYPYIVTCIDGSPFSYDSYIPSVLYYAVKYNQAIVFNHFLTSVPLVKINNNNYTLLDLAIESKAFYAMNLLLHNAQYRTQLKKNVDVLYKICASKSCEMLLIAFVVCGWDINKIHDDGMAVIHYACLKNDLLTLQFVLEHGGSVNVYTQDDQLPIHFACEFGTADVVKLLLDHGSNVDVCDKYGNLPIHVACANEKYGCEIVKLLLKLGQSLDVYNKFGNLPIHLACMNEKNGCDIVKLLLKLGQSLDVYNKFGNLPIHFACQYGTPDVVKLLLDRGSKVDVCNQDGNLPISRACANQKYGCEIVKLLLKIGQNLDIYNKFRNLPIHFACEYCSADFVKLFLDHNSMVLQSRWQFANT